MRLLKPNIEKIDTNVFRLTCPRFVADYLKKHWDKEKIQVDESVCIGEVPGYPEQSELCFVMPIDSVGYVEEGSYEYGEYPNTCPGLAAHVTSENATYVAQNMGGSGDSQYTLVKTLCDISEAIVDVMEQYGTAKNMFATKPKKDDEKVLECVNVGTLADMDYCRNMIPMNAATRVVMWGTPKDFIDLSVNTGTLEPRDVRWFADALAGFAYRNMENNKEK